jgi:ABC-type dipeptide/oligopeptide/nickel transport system ATPase component
VHDPLIIADDITSALDLTTQADIPADHLLQLPGIRASGLLGLA